ncbi:GPW/gp25 family protein [Streptomyces sp. I05A-00742]|uniref:GPW/gp25 family protein n=1 Tax=Streptomyces sp. I05A-00742 TaxID=2732853 RepID=UPI001BB24AEB|nr:GPW/gp25 family protein [Streptomyces sp. I05A-00742]
MSRLAFPFAVTALGRSATVAYGSDAHVRQMLELLVLTLPGERVMRPELGSPAQQLVFGPQSGPTAVALGAALQSTIQQWLGGVLTVRDVAVEVTDDSGAVEIVVTYEVRSSGSADEVRLRKDRV